LSSDWTSSAMAPSDLVGTIAEDVQSELNTVFNLDSHLGVASDDDVAPVDITVRDLEDANSAGD